MEKPQEPPPQTSCRDGFESLKGYRRAHRRGKRKSKLQQRVALPPPTGISSPPEIPQPTTLTRKEKVTGEHSRSLPNAKRRTNTNLIGNFSEPTSRTPPAREARRGELILPGSPPESCAEAAAQAQRDKRSHHEVNRAAVAVDADERTNCGGELHWQTLTY